MLASCTRGRWLVALVFGMEAANWIFMRSCRVTVLIFMHGTAQMPNLAEAALEVQKNNTASTDGESAETVPEL